MTKQEALETVAEAKRSDDDTAGPESYAEAAEIFTALFGRQPDAEDGDQCSLWSHCCSYTEESPVTESTEHPLRAAVNAAAATLQFARDALQAAEEQAELSGEDVDTAPLEEAVGQAEDELEAACRALIGSDCPREWDLSEGGFVYRTMTACSVEDALELARVGVDRSNYSGDDGTLYIGVRVYCPITEEQGSDTVTCEAEEPDCDDDQEHDWQSPIALVGGCKENPGVHGHGGGVLITEVCRHCGCKRVTDTWAQNPTTGEQGLRSVEYEEGAFEADELNAAFLEHDEA
jgi:hypothetical protein